MTTLPGREKRAAQRALEALVEDKAFLDAALDAFAKAYGLDNMERELLLSALPVDKMVAEIRESLLNRFLIAATAAAIAKTMV